MQNVIADDGEVEYFEPVIVGLSTVQPLIKVEAFHNRTFELSGIVGSVRVKEESLQEIIDALQSAIDWSRDL